VLGALAGEVVGLRHELREQAGDLLVVGGGIAQHDPPDHPPERGVPGVPVHAPLRRGEQPPGLLARHRDEAVAEAMDRLGRVEHRLGEAPALLPEPVA
jgi:hypothetical protein